MHSFQCYKSPRKNKDVAQTEKARDVATNAMHTQCWTYKKQAAKLEWGLRLTITFLIEWLY